MAGARALGKKENICPKIMRIGVFFDGTGNNRFNDIKDKKELKITSSSDAMKAKLGKDADLEKFNKNRSVKDKEDRRSNIAKLFSIYKHGLVDRDKQSGKIRYLKSIYKEGVGTNAGKASGIKHKYNNSDGVGNYLTGEAAGTGGAKRINEAEKELKAILDSYPSDEFEHVIDVFGFSRGASQARDFVNTFNKRNKESEEYRFGYIGIFDTVGSFGVGGNNENFKPIDPNSYGEHSYINTRQKNVEKYFIPYNFHIARKTAERVLHMIADNEYRKNFPLSDISGSGHSEWRYIGAHSDVGGGYGDEFEGSGTMSEVIQVHKSYLGEFSERAEVKKKAKVAGHKIFEDTYAAGLKVKIIVYRERRVHPELSHVALHIMHHDALSNFVPFEDALPRKKEFKIPDNLDMYYAFSFGNKNNTTGFPNKETILESYVHRSHSNELSGIIDKVSMMPLKAGGALTRTVFANNPKNAVLK